MEAGHQEEKQEIEELLNKKFEEEKQRLEENLKDECNVKVEDAINTTKGDLRKEMN